MSILRRCDECHEPIDAERSRRPFTNLCFVCALAIYVERLASFALRRGDDDSCYAPKPGPYAQAIEDARIQLSEEKKMAEFIERLNQIERYKKWLSEQDS